MTGPDPPERDHPPGGDERDATEAAFAEIVAGWDVEPPVDEQSVPPPSDAQRPDPGQETAAAVPEPVPAFDEAEHYVPPEPPPIPVLAPRTFCGILIVVAGLVAMVFPGLLALSTSAGVPLGLLTVAGGIVFLLMGLRDEPDPGGCQDDGARL